MIKINLVREGRAVRGAGAAPSAVAAATAGPGASNINNILVLSMLVLGLLAGLGYWFFMKNELADRQDVIAEREVQAQKLEQIIKEVEEYQKRKDSLQQRIDLIEQLKQNQKGPVRIMDQISRDLPDLVWLDRMEIAAGTISLSGRGLNPNAIALFVENVKNDPFFEEPQLGTMQQVSNAPVVYSFDMTFAFSYAPKTAAGSTPAPDPTTTATAPAATQ
ncbi:MAG TPA: PilN domain-containing protein [Thermoanaerobaculia bacterium]